MIQIVGLLLGILLGELLVNVAPLWFAGLNVAVACVVGAVKPHSI